MEEDRKGSSQRRMGRTVRERNQEEQQITALIKMK